SCLRTGLQCDPRQWIPPNRGSRPHVLARICVAGLPSTEGYPGHAASPLARHACRTRPVALARIDTPRSAFESRPHLRLDDRVMTLVLATTVVASVGLITMARAIGATVADEPGRVATLLAL